MKNFLNIHYFIKITLFIFICFYLQFILQINNLHAEPLPGQIIVDPENASWLVYNRDRDKNGKLDPFFMCGPGDPEEFLYRGTRNPDGTRNGDQVD